MASFTVPNQRTGHSRLQPADVWRVDKRPPHAVPGNNLALELRPQDGRTTGAAHVAPPVSMAVFSRFGKDEAMIIQAKNASRPAASRHTILMGAIGVAATAALGLPVVLVHKASARPDHGSGAHEGRPSRPLSRTPFRLNVSLGIALALTQDATSRGRMESEQEREALLNGDRAHRLDIRSWFQRGHRLLIAC
jgi:hypothetical protein